jgi:predicted transcriptional regulator
MRPAATIAENIPLRTALAAMATAHQRQLLVLDAHGFPVGVLFDVDALHALYGRDD